MSDDEFLTVTRARRSNAGSRLKQLLDMENDTAETQTASRFINEEDENVNLLFQEDGEDGEFMESESEDEEDEEEGDEEQGGEEGEEQGDEEEGEGEVEEVEEAEAENPLKELESESDLEPVNSDDMLSDSDMSMSDSDQSEGEKELEKEERRKKRSKQQQSKLIPQIKKFKPNVTKKTSKPKKIISSDSLMQDLRRSSTRASAIENKEALVKKLREDEVRRASVTPIVREKERELTQEEKLAEAVETEKANVLSLELFQQQEVVKKERQKHLLQLKRAKMKNVVRLTSEEEWITPTQEIETARKLYTLITSRSKKRNIKRLRDLLDIDIEKYPGLIDEELPYVKAQKAAGEFTEGATSTEGTGATTSAATKTAAEVTETSAEATETSAQVENAESTESTEPESQKETTDPTEPTEPTENGDKPETGDKPEGDTSTQNGHTSPSPDTKAPVENGTDQVASEPDAAPIDNTEGDKEGDKEDKEDKEGTPLEKKQKKVKFADDVIDPNTEEPNETDTVMAEVESTPEPAEDSEPQEIFEGPSQRVCRNTVYLLEFEESKYYLNEVTIKNVLFGEESNLSGSRRFKDLKTILKVGKNNNPYTKGKSDDIDEMFTPATELTEDNAMFEELNRLPKLGIRQEIIEEAVEEDENDQDLVVTTEAPLGLYLPNGNKKICLITGSEVKYFDPNLGVPYSDVGTFKFLKSVELGNIPWYTMDGAYNDTGATEIYLGSKDGTTRLARGVPEGFD